MSSTNKVFRIEFNDNLSGAEFVQIAEMALNRISPAGLWDKQKTKFIVLGGGSESEIDIFYIKNEEIVAPEDEVRKIVFKPEDLEGFTFEQFSLASIAAI